MTRKWPHHEVAPALQTMMLDWMDNTAEWDEGGDGQPKLLFIYTDKISEVPLPPMAFDDHPRVMVKKLADVFEATRRTGELEPKPRGLVAVGMLLEFWDLAFTSDEERERWRRRNFAEHPKAVESRMLIAHQPGHRPVVAIHQRDRRGTGRKLDYPIPMMSQGPLVPGGHALPILVHLERLARAVLAAPATFLAGR